MSGTSVSITKPLVLVTGSAGHIGTALIEQLTPFYTVVGLDVAAPPEDAPDHEWVHCDLTNDDSIARAMRKIKAMKMEEIDEELTIASVVHLAAYCDFTGEPSSLYEDLTVRGTRRLLNHLHSLNVEQFIFTSSLLVMQPDAGHELSEQDAVAADWDYPASKIRAERVIHEHADRIPYVILRVAGVYDEGCHSVPLAQQIARIYEKRMTSYVFPGDKTHGQAMIHMDDLVECIQTTIAARRHLPARDTFLIAEPDVMSYADLQHDLGLLIHASRWPTLRVPKPLAKAGAWLQEHSSMDDDGPFIRPWMVDLADDHYEVDLTHAREVLGWEPCHRLRNVLPEMIGQLHADPQAWYEEHNLKFPEPIEFGNWKATGLQATPY